MLGARQISIEDDNKNTSNVGKIIISHPFGNGLYHLFMVIWEMIYYCFTHINDHN